MDMKKTLLLVGLGLLGAADLVSAQAGKDTTAQYYYRLASSKSADDKALLSSILYRSIQGNQEKDWLNALQYFSVMKKKATADSVEAIIQKKFPGGEYWRQKDLSKVYDAQGGAAKEAAYLVWIKKYPATKFAGSRILYDYATNDVARTYADEKNVKKALLYADKVETPAWKGEGWAGVAMGLEKGGFVHEAMLLYKKALDNSYAFKTTRKGEEGWDFAAIGYRGYCKSYAGCLLQEKQVDSALVYIGKADAERKDVDPSLNFVYAKILIVLGRDAEAYAKVDTVVKLGIGDEGIRTMHRELYVRLNPGGKAYDVYMADLQAAVTRQVIANLKNTIVNKPGHSFVLKDVDGNAVSSEDLKGKTVVLDFWATWCGPCKKSFPAMQMAVDKYKGDADVVFLFIHTWERGEADAAAATAAAKKYIVDNHYGFRVLMDLKDAETGVNKVVDAYGIQGIPTKFILDKSGNVRFQITGFSGGNEAAVEELSAMIEMVRRS